MIRLTTYSTSGRELGTTALLIGSMLCCAPLRAQTSGADDGAKITSVGPAVSSCIDLFTL